MLPESLQLRYYRFPGRAGELQANADPAGLIAELGGSYAEYHERLADELETRGGTPEPERYSGDLERYAADCNYVLDLLRAEAMLRSCRVLVAGQKDVSPAKAWGGRPLVDEAHRLVSVTGDDAARAARRGSNRARAWTPPAEPRA